MHLLYLDQKGENRASRAVATVAPPEVPQKMPSFLGGIVVQQHAAQTVKCQHFTAVQDPGDELSICP